MQLSFAGFGLMLISEEYRKEQEILHSRGDYGVVGAKYGQMVSGIIDKLEINTLLDYGAGKRMSLTETLKPERSIKYQAYDPGVPEMADNPSPAEMVVCCDVIEHIEPELLENVLDDLENLTEVVLFISVHCGPAGKVLSDNRNAHLTQKPLDWWFPKFSERFYIQTVQLVSPVEFFIIAHNSALDLA